MTLARSCLAETAVVTALVQEMLAEVGAGWNIGTFGALAEFHHVAQDPPPLITLTRTGGDAVTARGAIRIALATDVLPVAYEGLAKDPQAWTHARSFCLREESAGMGRHSVLTELGADHDARRSLLDEPSRVHDRDPGGERAHHIKVVRDVDERDTALRLQPNDLLEDPRLRDNVEPRRRLV